MASASGLARWDSSSTIRSHVTKLWVGLEWAWRARVEVLGVAAVWVRVVVSPWGHADDDALRQSLEEHFQHPTLALEGRRPPFAHP